MKLNMISLCFFLGACSSVSEHNTQSNTAVEQQAASSQTMKKKYGVSYQGEELIKSVNDYAKWLTQDLFNNIDFPDNKDTFIITNFALLDSNLNKTNHFGRQMAEAMMHEVHRTGFSVIDLKASGFIRMTETGDVFYQSADHMELSSSIDASHVITGTLTKHQGGYFVNAKVIFLDTKALVTSAQIFVPYHVVDAVMLEEQENTVQELTPKPGLKLKAYSTE